MRKSLFLLLSLVPIVLVGCSTQPSQPSEAELHKELSGPPNLRAMRDKMAGKAAAPAGGKFAGKGAGAPAPASAGTSN